MIAASCYDTTVFDGFPKERVEKHLLSALAAGSLERHEIYMGNQHISETMDIEDAHYLMDQKAHHLEGVPSLKHPYVITDPKTKRSSIFVDLRTMLTQDRVTEEYSVKSGSTVDYSMMLMRAAVQRLWLDGHQLELRSCSSIPAMVFARWIASTLAQKYMLDPREQETLEIITGYYYYNLFTVAGDKSAEDIDRVVSYMSRSMAMASTRCYEVIEAIGSRIDSVGALCGAYTSVTGSIRLKDFNPGHLFMAIGMGYFGMMGRELTAIAVEHPPTWMVMLSYAVTDSMYRKSNIGTMMDKGGMKQRAEDYVNSLRSLIHTYATK